MLLDERPIDLDAPGWVYEIKFDGYRLLAHFGEGSCYLRTRGGADATLWFPEIVDGLKRVPGGPYIVDGEVCVLDHLGRSDFNRLHARAKRRRFVEGTAAVTYCVFDLLSINDSSITHLPLIERKDRLAAILTPPPHSVLYVSHLEDHGRQLFEQGVRQLKLEGIVAKRADSIYQPGARTRDWVKIKRADAVPAKRFRP